MIGFLFVSQVLGVMDDGGAEGALPRILYNNRERLKLSRATGDIRGGDFLCAGLRGGRR